MGADLKNDVFVDYGLFVTTSTYGKKISAYNSGFTRVCEIFADGASSVLSGTGKTKVLSSNKPLELDPTTGLDLIINNQFKIVVNNNSMNQSLFGINSSSGNQLILGSYTHSAKDYDHATTTTPTLFIHSDTDPDTNNTQWISLTHDQTDGVIRTGSGDIALEGRYYGNLNIGGGGEVLLPNITDDNTFKIAFCNDTSVSGAKLVPILCYKRGGTQYWYKLITSSANTGTYT